MARKPNTSRQTEALLSTFLERPVEWRHGYDLSRDVGLQSGTLYPILMRLKEQGWLESQWEEQPPPGRPPRHFYRLTSAGRENARAQLADPRPSTIATATRLKGAAS
jgi:DNA-binding PadR family transcriptional regulator